MRWRDAASRLVEDDDFRRQLSEDILTRGSDGAFWECAPFCSGDERFEYEVVPSRAVAGLRLDARPFRTQLRGADVVTSFDNLGRDARLVVPTAPAAHLVEFLRAGQDLDAFWIRVGLEAQRRFGRTTWVSTSGLGVAWLHVRLDDRPKYYVTARFKAPPRASAR